MKNSVLFLIVISLCCRLAAQDAPAIWLSSEDTIQGWLQEYSVPAAGIGIIENCQIKELKVFGKLEKDRPAPVNTIFNIASQTKPVVAMLTLKLVEQGLWELDEPLSKYWIDPDVTEDSLHDLLTTRHVLSHQSGFENWRINEPSGKLTFHFIPGTKFQYSGEGFEYLRRALESKFDTSLDILLESELFKPLGMTSTQYCNDDLDINRFAKWHDARGEIYPVSYRTGINAADDLLTTVEDYCKLGIDVMNGAGLSPELFNDLITPQSTIKENSYYGLGWGLVRNLSSGEYALHHGGSDIGVRTMAVFLPETKRGIVIMTNGDMGMFVYNNIIKEALDIGEEILNIINKSQDSPQMIFLSTEIIDRYSGDYQQANGRFIRVTRDGNSIKVSGDGIPTAILYPQSENTFFVEDFDVRIEFIKTTPETPMHLIIYENGKQVMDIQRME